MASALPDFGSPQGIPETHVPFASPAMSSIDALINRWETISDKDLLVSTENQHESSALMEWSSPVLDMDDGDTNAWQGAVTVGLGIPFNAFTSVQSLNDNSSQTVNPVDVVQHPPTTIESHNSLELPNVAHIAALPSISEQPGATLLGSEPAIAQPPQKRRQKATTLRDGDWDPHKDRIRELLSEQGLSIAKVAEIMEREHGFHATYAFSHPRRVPILISTLIQA
jgi:hypothetical protein